MKTFALYDDEGAIHSVVIVDAPDEVRAGIVARPDLSVAEIDSTDFTPPTTEEELNALLTLVQNYHVVAPTVAKAELKKAK